LSELIVTIGGRRFGARFDRLQAPNTVAAFERYLPFRKPVIHVRWSGEAIWAPLDALDFALGPAAATSHPAPGQMRLYPGGVSETELILANGPACFASRAGQLAGNPLLTITEGLDELAEVGRKTLWEGAQAMKIASSAIGRAGGH
jgi:Protein of unknown function (DUF3830)